jgi:hypothetical protein
MAMRERLYVRATLEELERWKRTARAAGAPSLSAFTRDLLNADSPPASAADAVREEPSALDESTPRQDLDHWLAELRRFGSRPLER